MLFRSTVSTASSKGNDSPISPANNESLVRIQDQKSPSQAAPEGSPDHMTKEVTTASPTKDTPESTADFIPHPPEFQDTFAELETGLDLVAKTVQLFETKFEHSLCNSSIDQSSFFLLLLRSSSHSCKEIIIYCPYLMSYEPHHFTLAVKYPGIGRAHV